MPEQLYSFYKDNDGRISILRPKEDYVPTQEEDGGETTEKTFTFTDKNNGKVYCNEESGNWLLAILNQTKE